MKKLLFLTILLASFFFADRAFANDCVVAAGGGNWGAAATWTGCGGGIPTAADNVFATSTSGTLVISGNATTPSLGRSFDANGFTGIMVATSTSQLNLGDATAGSNNIALNIPAGMTFTASSTALITFKSTSVTQQTVLISNTYTAGNLTFNGASSNYAITANLTLATASTLTLTNGTLHTDGAADNSALTHSWGKFAMAAGTKTLTLGASSITIKAAGVAVWSIGTTVVSNTTLNAGTSAIIFTGSSAGMSAAYQSDSGLTNTYYDVSFTGGGTTPSVAATGPIQFHNFTYTGTALKTNVFFIGQNWTVTNTLNINGDSAINRVFFRSGNNNGSTLGSTRIITANGTISTKWADFQDITGAGTASWDLTTQATNSSGDAGGNSGITFTTAATQTWSGTSGGNWSTNAWTSRVPLPQDDVVINAAFSASQTITPDMPRLGHNIDFTGVSGGVILGGNTGNNGADGFIFGSLTFASGMTETTSSQALTLSGRSAGMPVNGWTLTTAGKTFNNIAIAAVGGTYLLQDSLTSSAIFLLSAGTFNANNFNVTAKVFTITGSLTRTLTMGSGTWTATGDSTNGTAWSAGTVTNLTFNVNTSTISFTNTSANSKTFAGGGLTYNNLSITGGGTGAVIFTGANTFNTFTIGAPKTVQFTAATTNTFTNFVANGSSGNVITISSVTAATHTLKQVGGIVNGNWLSLTNSIATGGALWYAVNSTDNGGNSGWIFTSSAPHKGLLINRAKIKIQNGKLKIQPQ